MFSSKENNMTDYAEEQEMELEALEVTHFILQRCCSYVDVF
jgi:hypothetical protein